MKIVKLTLIIFIFAFFIGCKNPTESSFDSKFEEGVAYYEAKRYQEAYQIVFKLAEAGHPASQGLLGSMYRLGLGIERSPQNAVHWYKKSANNGFAPAMENLATSYYRGLGVDQNCKESLYWYNRAVEQGSTSAMKSLYTFYKGSACSENDPEKSTKYLMMAASHNDDIGTLCKGIMYYIGAGVHKDYQKAKYYFKKIEIKNSSAVYYLSLMHYWGYGVDKDIKMAIKLLINASEMGSFSADYALAVLYFNGDGVDKDYRLAIEYALKSSDYVPKSLNMLGIMYEDGLGVVKDVEMAKMWYGKAAMYGIEEAKMALSRINAQSH